MQEYSPHSLDADRTTGPRGIRPGFNCLHLSTILLRPRLTSPRSQVKLVDQILPREDIERNTKQLLARLTRIDFSLLRACKTSLPAPSVETAQLVMASLLDNPDRQQENQSRLVRSSISPEGVLTLELNDPIHFNNQSVALISELLLSVKEVARLASLGEARAMVLQGVGPHFCTGSKLDESDAKAVASWPRFAIFAGEP